MELETEALCGAGHGERSADRRNQRNGYRERDWETRAGAERAPDGFEFASGLSAELLLEFFTPAVRPSIGSSGDGQDLLGACSGRLKDSRPL
jgi:Transposase, Mutator family